MFYDNDRPFWVTLVSWGICAGLYLWGYKNGQWAESELHSREAFDREMKALRDEITQIKAKI